MACALAFSIVADAGAVEHPAKLAWHVERFDGGVVGSHDGDLPLNPASVVKVATSLWALERLGADYRYETIFALGGGLDTTEAKLEGNLLVLGSGDPDFQPENAFLVAGELNRLGLRHVSGDLLVDERFWIGWEGGTARREQDADKRVETMAVRLREALDPDRWTRELEQAWKAFAERRSLNVGERPQVVIDGRAQRYSARSEMVPLVIHRSQPLVDLLRRFNVYSNNDIDRLEFVLGPPQQLERFLADLWQGTDDGMRIETTSGLGRNRLTPRQTVRLLRDFALVCKKAGIAMESLLPVMGCGPSTLVKIYPGLHKSGLVNGMAAKTGTLTTTDGGVSVLSGIADTTGGKLLFALFTPGSGTRLRAARKDHEVWLARLVEDFGGMRPHSCPSVLPYSDERAVVSPAPVAE